MSNSVNVSLKKLPHFKELPLPSYATLCSAGMDLMAAIGDDIILKPLERKAVPTGICIELPNGYEAQVRPRSGLALKNGITVLNTPGTIDSDYRGEICVILINLGKDDFKISHGMRIAQMIVSQYTCVKLNLVEDLNNTERGTGGFGSTGTDTKINKQVETKINKPVETKINKPVETKINKPVETKVNKPVETKINKPVETKINKPVETKVNKLVAKQK
jgi:dUTP pyrophosphatase